MRMYSSLLLLIIFTQTHTMLRTRNRPIVIQKHPSRYYSERHIPYPERVNNMVAAIKASSKKDSGKACFVNNLDKLLARQIEREQKKARDYGAGFNYKLKHELTDHQEVLIEATIKYLDELQKNNSKTS